MASERFPCAAQFAALALALSTRVGYGAGEARSGIRLKHEQHPRWGEDTCQTTFVY